METKSSFRTSLGLETGFSRCKFALAVCLVTCALALVHARKTDSLLAGRERLGAQTL